MEALKPGDIVRNTLSEQGYIVTANYINVVTVVRTANISNAEEWELVFKKRRRRKE